MAAENHFLPFWAAVCVVGVNLGLLSMHVHSCGDIVSASILIVSTYILSNGPEHCAIQLATSCLYSPAFFRTYEKKLGSRDWERGY